MESVQRSVLTSGLLHFWVKPQTDVIVPTDLTLTSQAHALIHLSLTSPFALPQSALELASIDITSPWFLEVCEMFTQDQAISQELQEYIQESTSAQSTSTLWRDLRNGRLTSSTFSVIINRAQGNNRFDGPCDPTNGVQTISRRNTSTCVGTTEGECC